MRPMTAREALAILRTIGNGGTPGEYGQARRLIDALVKWRTTERALHAYCFGERENDAELYRVRRNYAAAETKLAALERGESPKE